MFSLALLSLFLYQFHHNKNLIFRLISMYLHQWQHLIQCMEKLFHRPKMYLQWGSTEFVVLLNNYSKKAK